MRQLQRQILSAVLLALLLLSLFPAAALAEAEEAEGSIAPAGEREEDGSGEIALWEEQESEEEAPALCSLSFVCQPDDARVTVYDPSRRNGNGEAFVIEPEEDGSWLLERGEYRFSAGRKGYETVEDVPFFADGESKTVDLTLLPLRPFPREESGEETLYQPAYPLPTLTGDGATDTANVARSQLGYTKNGGTVYGAWWNDVTSWGVDYTYADWCAMFACWCAYQAGAGMDVSYNKNGANANLLMEWQLAHASGDRSFATKPQVGDFLFFGGTNGVAGHVAIVNAYDESAKRVYFIGGNQGNTSCVSRGDVSWGEDSYWGSQVVLGYGRPNYQNIGSAPIAGLEAASGGAGVIQVSGWAIDPDEPASPVTVRLCVGGPIGTTPLIYQFEAGDYRDGMEEKCPGAGPYHGFSKTISLEERGTRTLYFYTCDSDGIRPETLFATAEVNITTPVQIVYTVSYRANGGEGVPEDQVKTHDVPLTLSTLIPTRADKSGSHTVTLDPQGGELSSTVLTAAWTKRYTFSRWNTASDGSGVTYAPGDSYTENASVTLYARWMVKTTTKKLSLPTPVRTGYLFLGWAEDKNAASGMTGSYAPSASLTLYAIWAKKDVSLRGDVNGDGKVDDQDLLRLRSYLLGEETAPDKARADLHSDGEITILDLICLRKLLAGAA